MDKENKILNKLNKESSELFEIFLSYFHENENDSILFYKFLFHDIISNKNINSELTIKNIDFEYIFDDPLPIIEDYIDKVLEENENKNNFYNLIKDRMKRKKVDIKKKIEECDKDIITIKKIYTDIIFEKIYPANINNQLTFKNKSVLTYSLSKNLGLKLGEIFARYIFTSINKNNESSFEKFYDNHNIHSFYEKFDINENENEDENEDENENENEDENEDEDENENENENEDENDKNKKNNKKNNKNKNKDKNKNKNKNKNEVVEIKKFKNINNNFKYWIFYVKIIENLFGNNSDYKIIYNEKQFLDEINKLVKIEKIEKKKNKDKKKDKSKHKHYGGNDAEKTRENFLKHFEKVNKKDKSSNNKKNDQQKILKNSYLDIFNNCYINPENNISLRKTYIEIFNNVMKLWFKDSIKDNSNPNHEIYNPFYNLGEKFKKPIKIYFNNEIKDRPIMNSNINNNLRFDIFQSLVFFEDENNKVEIKNFVSELKIKLILTLFQLYKVKKNIYKKYIELLDEKIGNNNENIKKQNNKKEINTDKKQISEDKKQINILNKEKIININKKDRLKEINKLLEFYQNEIKDLDSKKGIKNYDKMILNIENLIKKLIIEKYEITLTVK